MFRQAARMFVSLAAYSAGQLALGVLLAFLGQRLTIGSTPSSRVGNPGCPVVGRLVRIVDGARLVGCTGSGQAGWRRRERPRETTTPRLGEGVPASRNGNSRRLLAGSLYECRHGCQVGVGAGDGLASSDAVVGVERAGEQGRGVRVGASMAARAPRQPSSGGIGHGMPWLVSQRPCGRVHILSLGCGQQCLLEVLGSVGAMN